MFSLGPILLFLFYVVFLFVGCFYLNHKRNHANKEAELVSVPDPEDARFHPNPIKATLGEPGYQLLCVGNGVAGVAGDKKRDAMMQIVQTQRESNELERKMENRNSEFFQFVKKDPSTPPNVTQQAVLEARVPLSPRRARSLTEVSTKSNGTGKHIRKSRLSHAKDQKVDRVPALALSPRGSSQTLNDVHSSPAGVSKPQRNSAALSQLRDDAKKRDHEWQDLQRRHKAERQKMQMEADIGNNAIHSPKSKPVPKFRSCVCLHPRCVAHVRGPADRRRRRLVFRVLDEILGFCGSSELHVGGYFGVCACCTT